MTQATTAPSSPLRHVLPWGLSWPLIVALGVLAFSLANGRRMLGDPDLFIHLAVGRWIIAHGAIPRVDMWSQNLRGAPWLTHEWLAQVTFALSQSVLGWLGPVAVAGLAFAAALGQLTRAMLRQLSPLHALLVVGVTWSLLMPHWLARPHALALPFLVLWMTLLGDARARDRAPPLAAALVMLAWANLHGSFLVGIGFAGFLALEAFASATGRAGRIATVRQWAPFLALAAVASILTPHGLATYLMPLTIHDMPFSVGAIAEWRSPDFQTLQPLEIWLLAFMGIALAFGIRLPLSRLLMLLLLIHMALKHARHADLLALIAPLLIGPAVAAQLPRQAAGAATRLDRWIAAPARPAGFAGMALAAVLAVGAGAFATRLAIAPMPTHAPEAAVQEALRRGVAGPVLNEYGFGGYLMFAGVPSFIDGRNELYGDAFNARVVRALDGTTGELPALLAEHRIAWTLMPQGIPAVALLDRLPGWRRLHEDPVAVVHVREGLPIVE